MTSALTILAEIDRSQRAELDAVLAAIAGDLDGNAVFRPAALPDTHFMRFVIVEDAAGELPALLAWEVNHDGDRDRYLGRVAAAVPGIDRVFAACAGYPGLADREAWLAWMADHSHRAAAFYCAYRDVSRGEVVASRRTHDAIRRIVDGERDQLDALPPHEIHRRLSERVRAIVGRDTTLLRFARKLGAIALGVIALPFALVALVPWYLLLRAHERRDVSEVYARPVHDDRRLRLLEDQLRQNQLTHVVDLRPGAFRLFTAWIVLTVIDVLARVYFIDGALGGITTIHFARWVIVRDRRDVSTKRHRLLFFSNYDGSWESYLGEFIDRAASGLTAVWSNTVGFPVTSKLVNEGARDEEAFKQWTRDHQIPSQVWWSGVPDSTVQNVRDDVWVKDRLGRDLAHRELGEWLDKL